MKKTTKFAALALSACMALGIMCFTACEAEPGKSAYDIWLEQGNTGTEQDFLDSLKGDDGLTPEIRIGTDGYWYIDGQKTDVKAKGENGEPGISPEVTISDDGYWEINGVKTSTKAQGENGEPGETPEVTISDDGYWEINGVKTSTKAQGESGAPGARGNKIYHGNGKPQIDEAIEGDMYIDIENWNVFFYESDAWTVKGNLKGEVVKYNKIDVKAGSTYKFDIEEEEGDYLITVDTGNKKLETGKLSVFAGETFVLKDSSLFCYSETRSQSAGSDHNIYFGFAKITSGTKTLTFSAEEEDVAGTVTLTKWEGAKLKAGETIEIPIAPNAAGSVYIINYELDDSIVEGSSYTFQITYFDSVATGATFKYGENKTFGLRSGSGIFSPKAGELSATKKCYFEQLTSSTRKNQTVPAQITITAK